MIRNIQFTLKRRPAWQRFLIITASIIVTAVLLWIGLIFVFGFALLALVVAAINFVKFKITGRPLFKGPQHFHRYQSQFKQHTQRPRESKGTVIEGEVIRDNDK